MTLRKVLCSRGSLALVAALTLLFLALSTFFDLREGGRQASLTTTRLATPGFYAQHFGALYAYGSIVLNVLTSLLSALLIALAVANWRARTAVAGGAACSTAATTALGFAVFGCPGCYMPLAGTLGVAFFAKALPLQGLEFKVLSLLILAGTLLWLARRVRAVAVLTAPSQRHAALARGSQP
jgi:uncharacterized iron-regulated membrane protein